MSVHYWRYTLRPRAPLNAMSGSKEIEGVLLRIGEGFACLQPWPELGDDPLETQLRCLAGGLETPLIRSAIRCAEVDGSARKEGRSLFDHSIPDSHWLVQPGDGAEKAQEAGFQAAKFKIGPGLPIELEAWAHLGFRLRLDANESFSESGFLAFWEALGEMRRSVEFVEDPVPWSDESWSRLREVGVPIAADRKVEERHRAGDWSVIKPASTDWLPPAPDRFVVTSSMDHAIGQLWAAWCAMNWQKYHAGRMAECGLLTHRCFETDPFFEQLSTDGPRLLPPPGRGLGFDDLLESLPWKRLT